MPVRNVMKGPNGAYAYYINGTSFNHDVVNETIKLGSTEEWEFTNLTYEPHPLHIHANPFQIVSINGQPSDENFYRDTAIIPPFGTLTIRHTFEDYTVKYVMHCHILFHEDHGMMQLLESSTNHSSSLLGQQLFVDEIDELGLVGRR